VSSPEYVSLVKSIINHSVTLDSLISNFSTFSDASCAARFSKAVIANMTTRNSMVDPIGIQLALTFQKYVRDKVDVGLPSIVHHDEFRSVCRCVNNFSGKPYAYINAYTFVSDIIQDGIVSFPVPGSIDADELKALSLALLKIETEINKQSWSQVTKELVLETIRYHEVKFKSHHPILPSIVIAPPPVHCLKDLSVNPSNIVATSSIEVVVPKAVSVAPSNDWSDLRVSAPVKTTYDCIIGSVF